tara:strand:- start:2157 stop:2357 length:201 start_codon:yes stop_codon:yes gene_type:complete
MIGVKNVLLEGDACSPDDSDMIAQTATMKIGEEIPDGGWRVLGGGLNHFTMARIVYRYEIKGEKQA